MENRIPISKILVPVPVERSLPEIADDEQFSATVVVTYINLMVSKDFSAMAFAHCDHTGRWYDASPDKPIEFWPDGNNQVVEWFREKKITSLFPDEDTAYNVAQSAAKGTIDGTSYHTEGQSFLKNHVIKQLLK